jgi:hypothetical protein
MNFKIMQIALKDIDKYHDFFRWDLKFDVRFRMTLLLGLSG